jgi:CDGSH-type Zn-finger protein
MKFISRQNYAAVTKFLLTEWQVSSFASKTTMTKITVNNNGSLKIDGDFEIVDKDGKAYGLQGRTIVSLCRCGKSANKPFCDGSHKEHFEHEAVAFDLPPKKV